MQRGRAFLAFAVLLVSSWAAAQTPVGTPFTYQGRLTDTGVAATGIYDLTFSLYDAATEGSQVGSTLTKEDVAVTNGLFTVSLDFGTGIFNGEKRWLEISVRTGDSTGPYTTLAPRQELTPAPNATFSATTGDPAVQRRSVAPTCPTGEYLRSLAADGTPTCEPDLDTNSGGTVTSVATGAGLTGGPITASGTVSVADGGITSAKIANGAIGLAQIDTAQVQARVSSGCPEGMMIQQVNADGSVVCRADSLPQPGFAVTALDGPGIVGYASSVTIGADGLGLISYYDHTNGDLKVAHCANTACTSATLTTLDSAGEVGNYSSVTIGADGLGLISYFDKTNGDLRLAHCSNAACTSATLTTVDSTGQVGLFTSVTIGADGLGLISYSSDYTNYDLKVAHCSDPSCTSATLTTLDSTGEVGPGSSVTIGADGLGLISYYDYTNYDLKVAHCSDPSCTSAIFTTLDSAGQVGYFTSLTVGSDDLGLISYYDYTNGALKVAHCSNTACTSATLTTLDSIGGVGNISSVTIGADGLGLISYFDQSDADLKVAHCSNAPCTSATLTTVDSTGLVGGFSSVTVGADGLGLISYYDYTNGDLKVAHCSNLPCQPFVRRR
jgi:hypothetical protein